ncbi:SCO3374 family protein [Streptomyces hokutonensis]|uniref:SCO3374 family protein n=1 Tax=Streptomyces hokutonensis TaxID=1306990 RepID=UPI0003A70780|nr:SCO3374 family protein [Streptomyces hokutonensis]
MVGTVPPVTTVPSPRRPPDPDDRRRHWYENELGWRTVPGEPLRLVTGLRFDVLDVPVEAGVAALWRLGPDSPVAVRGDRMRLLVAAGSAEELPGLLDWLEWGALAPALDLVALGEGGHMEAPPVPGAGTVEVPPLSGARPAKGHPGPSIPAGRPGPVQGAAVWLRPPEPGREVEASLPTLSAVGGVGDAPDLVRLVDTVATQCHRVRLRRSCAQPLAFS